ncbi:hypothetical protein [Aliidiomarina soli]|uniref:Uncharacterized protein n=1 Tax=Aliidiomarina soli TaxID=1928574 RepID=A0A432WC89_9GAMM|nr:hypothetical protein [Aliidiomarina soli]RUO29540.1 hypothetical protein CWE14_13840 [Aliidiomarina soli]
MSLRKLGIKKTFIIFGIILFIPLAIYTYQFGLGIWPTHDDWAKMGSALGGIYAPILSALTLYMIYRQLRLQAVIHVDQMDWQRFQTSRQHGLYLCEKLKELIKIPLSQNNFMYTLEQTGVYEELSKDKYLELVGRDETSMLIHQLIVLLRKLRFCETGKEIRYHLKGLALASVGAENLNGFEVRMCRWHDIAYEGFSKDLCVFTDQSDLDFLAQFKT